ncbi:MAG: hypothetical protein WCI29_12020 [Actinomycetes bacterium]
MLGDESAILPAGQWVPSGSSGVVPVRVGSAVPAISLMSALSTNVAAPTWSNAGARRRSSSVTFGLTGRIVGTALVTAASVYFVAMDLLSGFFIGLIVLPPVAGLILKSLWSAAPTRVPRPMPAAPSSGNQITPGS